MNLIFFVFWCYLWSSSSAYKRSDAKLADKQVVNATTVLFSSQKNVVKDKWFVQDLDHFNAMDSRTWKQRYHMSMKYFKKGGPVFLMVGGKEEISPSWMISGAWIEYAQSLNAACFQLEHRFYGMSHPTDNVKTSNLAYLTVEQALADLATFISTISIEKEDVLDGAKWVGFGSSYSGSLVTWLRLKYPHLLHAAVASGSLLRAEINFEGYFMDVQRQLSDRDPACARNIRQANKNIIEQLKTYSGAKYIEKKFNTCARNLNNSTKNVQQLFRDISRFVAIIGQDDEDESYFDKYIEDEEPTVTLKNLCDIMLDEMQGTVIDRYAVFTKKYILACGSHCLSNTYDWRVMHYADTSWNSTQVKNGNRQWLYQTCTQLGFFKTSNHDSQLFGNAVPLEYYTRLCWVVFGEKFKLKTLSKGVQKTNMMYGDITPRISRVIFVHGTADPWRSLGLSVLSIRPIYSYVIKIQGASHCADIHPSYSSDPPDLSSARKEILMHLKVYLREMDYEEVPIYINLL